MTQIRILKFLGGALLLCGSASAEVQKWTYEGTTLTEILSAEDQAAGKVPWVLSLSKAGVLTSIKSQAWGTNPELDLRAEVMPEGTPVVTQFNVSLYNTPAAATIERVYFSEGLTSIGSNAFRGCSKLDNLELPLSLTTIGGSAIRDCTSLASVTPFLSTNLTSLASQAFQNCPITNVFEIGFTTNSATGEPVMITLNANTLASCSKIPSARIGPGVTTIPNTFFGCAAMGFVELGCNVTDVQGIIGSQGSTKLTNVVFLATDTVVFSVNRAFREQYNLKEITWNGWFEYTAEDATNPFRGWKTRQCRFIVPGDNAQWLAYIADATKVTPWSAVTSTVTNDYYTKYGTDAKEPAGVSIAVANGLPQTYIVKTDAKPKGFPLTVSTSDARFATVTCSPEPSASGFYDADTEVTVTVNVAEGSTFHGWIGSVPEGCEQDVTLTLTMSEAKSLYACVTSDSYVFENGTLTDGELKLSATRTITDAGAVTNFSIVSVVAHPAKIITTYDFAKPIRGGGSVIALGTAGELMRNNAQVRRVILPETLKSIGNAAFRECANLVSVEPCLPHGITTYGSAILMKCPALTNALEVGFATDPATHQPVFSTFAEDMNNGSYLSSESYRIPTVRFGPGVGRTPLVFFGAPKFIEFGVNLTNVCTQVTGANNTSLTGMVFRTSQDVVLKAGSRIFRGPNAIREIVWNGWFTYTPDSTNNPFYDWTALQCRFFVPRNNPKWQEFLSCRDNFTPWGACSAAVKTAYYDRYGADARKPAGVTVKVPNGLPATYIILNPKQGLCLMVR